MFHSKGARPLDTYRGWPGWILPLLVWKNWFAGREGERGAVFTTRAGQNNNSSLFARLQGEGRLIVDACATKHGTPYGSIPLLSYVETSHFLLDRRSGDCSN